jgi:CheY-like chemotaxis protein
MGLSEFDPTARPPITQGRAVVAHDEMGRRRVLGRILRQAGFDVSFAASADEATDVARTGEVPSLVVAKHELSGGGALTAVRGLREAVATRVPFVVLGAARDLRDLGRVADGLGSVAVTSELAPPDNLLFLANELLRPGVENARASARLLHGALCGFRPAGELESEWGLTYNISREGIYVRTLDAPAPGTEVWLELRPPRSTRAVQLTATVVWRRGAKSGASGASPPGFGARILPESCAIGSLSAYHEGYERLRAEPRLLH